eukprot:scaffold6016_cov119-Isochrysis_galbana.AAC.18
MQEACRQEEEVRLISNHSTKKNGRVGRPTPRASGQDPGDARHEYADGRSVAQTMAREASSVQAEAACSVIARGGSSVARHGVNAVLGKEALLEGDRVEKKRTYGTRAVTRLPKFKAASTEGDEGGGLECFDFLERATRSRMSVMKEIVRSRVACILKIRSVRLLISPASALENF